MKRRRDSDITAISLGRVAWAHCILSGQVIYGLHYATPLAAIDATSAELPLSVFALLELGYKHSET